MENMKFLILVLPVILVVLLLMTIPQSDGSNQDIRNPIIKYSPKQLTASWYSEESLKNDGQWHITHGIMANGEQFDDTKFTCASWDYPLGTSLSIMNKGNGKTVFVHVTDRTNRRLRGERIDLSLAAFKAIASLNDGVVFVHVEQMR